MEFIKLVFPHQLVRLYFAEQVYRACTIIRNEKYHHFSLYVCLMLLIILYRCPLHYYNYNYSDCFHCGFRSEKVIDDLIFYPPAITEKNQYYRFITCGFIHADIAPFVFNMYAFYLFGECM